MDKRKLISKHQSLLDTNTMLNENHQEPSNIEKKRKRTQSEDCCVKWTRLPVPSHSPPLLTLTDQEASTSSGIKSSMINSSTHNLMDLNLFHNQIEDKYLSLYNETLEPDLKNLDQLFLFQSFNSDLELLSLFDEDNKLENLIKNIKR